MLHNVSQYVSQGTYWIAGFAAHSSFLAAEKATVQPEYTGQSGMERALLWHIQLENRTRVLGDIVYCHDALYVLLREKGTAEGILWEG